MIWDSLMFIVYQRRHPIHSHHPDCLLSLLIIWMGHLYLIQSGSIVVMNKVALKTVPLHHAGFLSNSMAQLCKVHDIPTIKPY